MDNVIQNELLMLMKSKRKRDPGPKPEPKDYEKTDLWRAALFGWWLKSRGISIDGFSAATKRAAPPGVSRTAVISLSGAAGSAVTSTWSGITRPVLLAIHKTMNAVEPLTLTELREMMRIPADHAPDVWREESSAAGAGLGLVNSTVALRVTWDPSDPRPPHVWQSSTGYHIGASDVESLVRLGRLRAILPLD